MDPVYRVSHLYQQSMYTQALSLEGLAPLIADAADLMVQTLLHDGKVMTCGESNAGQLSQLLATSLLNRFDRERPGLPALCLNSDAATLNAIAVDNNLTDIFSRQIRAVGQEQDLLLVLAAADGSGSMLQAIQAAHDRAMPVIAICGDQCNDIASLLSVDDVKLPIPSTNRARVTEVQLLIIHCLCDLIDRHLFGSED